MESKNGIKPASNQLLMSPFEWKIQDNDKIMGDSEMSKKCENNIKQQINLSNN